MRKMIPTLFVVASVVAGCAGPEPAGEALPEPPSLAPTAIQTDPACASACVAPLGTGPARALVLPLGYDCSGSCFEPSVAIDGDGRILASRGYTPSGLAVSEDGGATWQSRDRPPVPEGRGPTLLNQGDITLQSAPDGSVYYTLLYIDLFEPVAGSLLVLDGMQVAATRDGGLTWHVNKYLSFRDGPGNLQAINPDRQWLAFGPGSTVYVSVNFFSPVVLASGLSPFGIYVARSDDGGAVWGDFVPVAMNLDRGIMVAGGAGRAAVSDDGTVFLPLRDDGDSTPFLGIQGDHVSGLAVAVSKDQGATWERRLVDAAGVGDRMAWLPQISWDQDALHLAWIDVEGGIWAARSLDGGETWGPGVRLAQDAVVGPWIESGPLGSYVAWSTGTQDRFDVHIGRIDWATNRTFSLTLAQQQHGNHGNTDFSHFDLTSAGQPVVVWANNEDDLYVGTWS
ncbi:MAG: hypothetical protein ACPGQL_06380 [Thermoplasmatota archaeon]